MIDLPKTGNPDLQPFMEREAIRELAGLYCHYVWQRDIGQLMDLFTDDAVVNVTIGKAALTSMYSQALRDRDQHPYAHTHIIELKGPSEGSGFCYADFYGVYEGKSMLMSGYWKDGYAKRDGRWKFSSRHFHQYFYAPITVGWAEQGAGGPSIAGIPRSSAP